jgi:hypothetical protein
VIGCEVLIQPFRERTESLKRIVCDINVLLIELLVMLLAVDELALWFSEDGRTIIGWFMVISATIIVVIQLLIDIK